MCSFLSECHGLRLFLNDLVSGKIYKILNKLKDLFAQMSLSNALWLKKDTQMDNKMLPVHPFTDSMLNGFQERI